LKSVANRERTVKLAAHRFRGISVAAVVPLLLALTGCTKYGATLLRPEDPVVLDGSSTPKLLGDAVAAVVGFAWDGSAWHQIPAQVDERDYVNPGQMLHRATTAWATNPDGTSFKVLVYTTSAAAAGYTSWPTYVGGDSDPTFDANDQVSFLANDSGKQSPAGAATPAGTVASSREEIKVTDPLNASQLGYVYLFSSNNAALTSGSGGTTGVHYTFSLDSGDYRNTYKMGTAALAPNNVAGFNPEHSTITTGAYKLNYSDRWLNDGLQITAKGTTGPDMLERGRYQFTPGVCSRSEETFDGGATNPYEGAFIANISGPVRAIRSYIGANSGPYTVMTEVFYPQRSDSTADLRVHAIPGVMAFDDFTTGLTGMTYSDDQNTGVPIDGHPDTINAAHVATWQMVSGAPGSIVTTRSISTDITGLQLSTYYLDQNPASPVPCTGDAAAWGQNGVQILGPGGGQVPCTDPTRTGCSLAAKTFSVTRYRSFAGLNLSSTSAATLAGHALSPLQVTVSG
jgi:hypothetical protein